MNEPNETLHGKVALVTGAAHRVGASIVRMLHAEGMNVVLHYRNSVEAARKLQEELNKLRPESVQLVSAELSHIDSLPRLVSDATKFWGRLDVVVNNASSFYPTPVADATEEHWNDLMASNLKAPFFLAQAALPHLRQHKGSIINIVDIHAERPLSGYSIYSIAKAGLVMLTKSLARELGPDIRVNGVAPGAILWPEGMEQMVKEEIIDRTALKRRGEPEDIARAVRYLVRDAVYTTGQVLAVDGGRSLGH
jgi:pteridine reductase